MNLWQRSKDTVGNQYTLFLKDGKLYFQITIGDCYYDDEFEITKEEVWSALRKLLT